MQLHDSEDILTTLDSHLQLLTLWVLLDLLVTELEGARTSAIYMRSLGSLFMENGCIDLIRLRL